MKNKIYFIPFICTLLLMKISFAQEITLPYQEVGGVPIVNVNINGENHDFVFDTGADMTLIDSTLSKNLKVIDSSSMEGIYGKKKWLRTVQLNHLRLDKTDFRRSKAFVMNFKSIRKHLCGIHLDGILGINIMEGYIIEIDSRHRLIKFYNPKKFDKEKLNGFSRFSYWHYPRIKLKINSKKHIGYFDTGSSQGLNLAGKDKLLEYAKNHPHITAYSSGGVGLYGKDRYIAKSHKVDTLHIKFGGWFNHIFLPSSPVSVNPDAGMDNMGFQYIKQFHVFLDQHKHKLYLKPYPQNEQEKYVDSLFKYGFDLDFDFDRHQFYVNARVELNTQLKIGDIVIKINGHKLPQEKCGLADFKKEHLRQEMKMTILRDGTEKVIDYKVPENLKKS